VLVESPAKAKKIQTYLGSDYKVVPPSTVAHTNMHCKLWLQNPLQNQALHWQSGLKTILEGSRSMPVIFNTHNVIGKQSSCLGDKFKRQHHERLNRGCNFRIFALSP
jgi:hypothetical protein